MSTYRTMMQQLASGWNTWNTNSIYCHVHLPSAFSIDLVFKDGQSNHLLEHGFIGHYSHGANTDLSLPEPRSWDGYYTELDLTWRENHFRVQSAEVDDEQLILITPIDADGRPNTIAVQGGLLWGREGSVRRDGNELVATTPAREYRVFVSATTDHDPYFRTGSPYLVCPATEPLAVSTGRRWSVDEVRKLIAERQQTIAQRQRQYGELAECYEGLHAAMAWNTIYDPLKDRVVSPVSRVWNYGWNGYVLFCWDTYFAGLMAGIDNKAVAYANVVEITREHTAAGFVPNFASGGVRGASEDRSQPPVGARVAWQLYRRWGDEWFLAEIFDDLLTWNRWWAEHRMTDRWLGWGSNGYSDPAGEGKRSSGTLKGAVLESGLDNSPMYDHATFDEQSEVMNLADAGLCGMYVMDCRCLAAMADVLDRSAEAQELRQRAEQITAVTGELWDEATGIFRNRHTDSGEVSDFLSPTNFYPLCGGVADQQQAERMMTEHLFNEDEFWGEWVLPSIARKDPGFEDQKYWRGRVWGPLNQIVYWGLQEYDLPDTRQRFADASAHCFLKEWREHKHVHENYNSITGEGVDAPSSNRFYHWGALLALIPLIEAGHYPQDHATRGW